MIQGKQIHNASIIDVMPTLLYLMKVGIPNNLDGKICYEGFSPSHLENHHPTFIDHPESYIPQNDAAYSQKEISQIEDRLKKLGYL